MNVLRAQHKYTSYIRDHTHTHTNTRTQHTHTTM